MEEYLPNNELVFMDREDIAILCMKTNCHVEIKAPTVKSFRPIQERDAAGAFRPLRAKYNSLAII